MMENMIITCEESSRYNIVSVSYIKEGSRAFVVLLSSEGMPDIKAIVKYEESAYYPDVFYPKIDFKLIRNLELSLEAQHKLVINISRVMTNLVSII